jgi:hypothetical protein
MWSLLQANGFKGSFIDDVYSQVLVKLMSGSMALATFVNPTDDNPGMNQLKSDVDAIQPGSSAKVDLGVIFGYASTDMFIEALEQVAR